MMTKWRPYSEVVRELDLDTDDASDGSLRWPSGNRGFVRHSRDGKRFHVMELCGSEVRVVKTLPTRDGARLYNYRCAGERPW